MKITAEGYGELLDGEDWSPELRAEFEYRRKQAEKREALLAKMSEQSRRQLLVHRWQQESLRVFHQLFAKQFEVVAWESRERKPLLVADARNALEVKRRGVRQRIARARREAAHGCGEQSEWLALHAELIEALELQGGTA